MPLYLARDLSGESALSLGAYFGGNIKGWYGPEIILHAKDIAFFANSCIDAVNLLPPQRD